MRRRYLRALLTTVVVIAVPLTLLQAVTRVDVDHLIDIDKLKNESIPDLLQRIRDFHRIVTRNGVKLLEVSAKEASYFRDSSAIEIVEPRVVFFDEGTEVGRISGGHGTLFLDGTELKSVDMSGGVLLGFVDFEVRAERVTYDRTTKQVVTFGPAVLASKEFEVRGSDLTIDLSTATLRIPSSVDMTVHRRSRAATGGSIGTAG